MSNERVEAPPVVERATPVFAAVITFVVASTLVRPVVFPDESASLAAARHLAGIGEPAQWWFQPGYGYLLSPILWFRTDVGGVFVGVHLVNALLAGSVSFCLLRLDRLFAPERPSGRRVVAVLLVSTYPAYLYFSGLAIADNLLAAAVAWTTLALPRVLGARRDGVVFLSVVPVASLVLVHARAFPLAVAWVLVLSLERFRSQPRQQFTLTAVGSLSLVVARVAGQAMTDYDGATALAPLTRQSAGALLEDLVSLRAMLVLPFTALGQAMYLLMASLGLIFLGLAVLLRAASSGQGPQRSIAQFVLITLGLSWMLSSVFTNQGQGDLAMYGRYLEVVSAVPLLLGFGAFVDGPIPSWFRSRLIPGLVLLTCFVVGIRGYDAFGGRNQLLNVSGTAAASRLVGQLDPVAYVALAAIAMLLLHLARTRHLYAGVMVLGLFFVANAFVLYENAVIFAGRAAERLTLLDDLDSVDPSMCVALDQALLTDFFTQENYRVHDLERDYLFWNSLEADTSPCEHVVISENTGLGDRLPGWQPVAIEVARPQWLWVSPSLAPRFEGRVIRPLPGTALTSPSAEVHIELLTSEADNDDPIELEITITNTSAETFVPVASLPEGSPGVALGLEWRDPSHPSVRLHEPVRVSLPNIVRPGESVTVLGSLSPSTPGFTAVQGDWLVRGELVQEFVRWFDDAGGASASAIVVDQVQR